MCIIGLGGMDAPVFGCTICRTWIRESFAPYAKLHIFTQYEITKRMLLLVT